MIWIKKKGPKVAAFIFLFAMALIWILPVLYAVLSSFKSNVEINSIGYKLLPQQWIVENYVKVLTNFDSAPIVRWFLNSLLIAVSQTVLVLIIASSAAYAYSRLKFKGRDFIFWILLSTMMFPSIVNLIPLYKIVSMFNWIDTPLAIIVPGVSGVFNIFLIKQFMVSIPKEYDESARIDGASDFQIYFKVILPLIRPVLTVVALFTFTGAWNDFLWPSIVYNNIENLPLTPALQLFQGMYVTDYGRLTTSAVIAIIPTFILYLFTQKYFLEGLNLSSGIKG
ncbi:carbohydrate ABC transporter permease [Clostridium folliculivorans]|uniref:Sugar ABC transporter permease n=1 Tax=Clostridium folliculivorans TaxID=2886038 RepID=A0A9W6D933_9CLOT|nr:carbohydrate ABC transporter permease [Clostridium folliculivorans]GKU23714.1 sugar ABC transporter permease [Clostridium folliculivorans]GKU29830.1 sugar ABC transporter permease [Clostridium folliculivorans]